MNRWATVALGIVTVLVVGGIAVAAYSVGWDNGAAAAASTEVVEDGVIRTVGPGWGHRGWFPFGFVFPLLFLFFLVFLVSRAVWWRPWRHVGNGPGPWGGEHRLEDWHRQAHGEQPKSDPTGPGA